MLIDNIFEHTDYQVYSDQTNPEFATYWDCVDYMQFCKENISMEFVANTFKNIVAKWWGYIYYEVTVNYADHILCCSLGN